MADGNLNKELILLQKQLESLGASTGEIQAIQRAFQRLTGDAEGTAAEMERVRSRIEQLKSEAEAINTPFKDLLKIVQQNAAALDNNVSSISKAKSLQNKVLNITQDLKMDSEGISDISKRQLESKLDTLEATRSQLKSNADLAQMQLEALEAAGIQNQRDAKRAEQLREILSYQTEFDQGLNGIIAKTKERLDLETSINENMGVAGALVGGTGALMERLGMRSGIFNEAMDDATTKMREMAKDAGNNVNFMNKLNIAAKGFSIVAKGFGKALMDPTAIGLKLLDTFFKINEQSVEISRLTGQSASNFDTFGNGAASAIDQMEVVAELTKEIGINAQNAFSKGNLQGAANLKVEMGLAAGEAGNLAMMAQVSGDNVENLTDNIVSTVSQFNGANRAAVSQGVILRDIGNVSEGIRASFAGNTEALVKGAAAARRLGMDIKELDSIANSLLDFESSIGNELEAQLLTGKNINMAKARELALSNDLEGLGKELFENSASLVEFGKMNRIQQEAQAKALGMTRDQLAKVAYQRALETGMTEDQAAAAASVNAEDMKRLKAQENFTKAIEKVTAAIAPILDGIGNILSIPWVPQILLGAVAAAKLFKAFKSFAIVQKLTAKNFDIMNAKQAIFGKMYKGGQFMPGGGRAKAGGEKAGGLLSTLFGKKGTAAVPKGAGETGGKGISGISNAISKIDMKKVLQGAAALAIVAGAVFIFGKAVQQFMEVSWSDLGKAIVGMFALVGAVAAIGSIMMSGVGAVAILAGSAAMLIMAGAVLVLGYGVQALASGFNMMIPNLVLLAQMVPQLFGVGLALMSIAAGLGAIAFAGLAAIPALSALSMFALAATPLIALGGMFAGGGEEDGDGFARLESKLDTLIEVISTGGNVYLDSDKIGRTQAKSFSKLTA